VRLVVTDEKFRIRPMPFAAPGWHITLEHQGSTVEVRPVLPGESLAAIFRLTYDVYVNEKGIVDVNQLSDECRESRAKWDDWDFLPSTRHYVASVNGEIIGHTRVINDSTIGVPLERTGFDLTGERSYGHAISEFSKLIIRPSYRGTPVLSALLWQVFQQKKIVDQQPCIYFSCEPAVAKVYRRMGATEIGAFLSSEFNVLYTAMRMDFGASYNEHVTEGSRMHLRPHALPRCMSTQRLQRCADKLNAGLVIETWRSEQLASGGADVAGVCRVFASGKDSQNGAREWSCVAKTIRHGGNPIKRELTTYRSPLAIGTRVNMPRLLEVMRGHFTDTLILEDVQGSHTRTLQLSDLADLAEQIGRWHGTGICPSGSAYRNWLREYVREAEPLVAVLPEYRCRTSLLDCLFTEPVSGLIAEIWGKRGMLLDGLEALPHAYSHQDLVAANVAVRQGAAGRIYHLMDWDIAGMAPLGAELAPMLVGSAILMHWNIQASSHVLDDVIDAYRQGLLSTRVKIDADTIRLSLMVSSAVRYIAWCGHRVGSVMDPAKHYLARKITGHSLPEMIANYSTIREYLAAWGASAIAALTPADSLERT